MALGGGVWRFAAHRVPAIYHLSARIAEFEVSRCGATDLYLLLRIAAAAEILGYMTRMLSRKTLGVRFPHVAIRPGFIEPPRFRGGGVESAYLRWIY